MEKTRKIADSLVRLMCCSRYLHYIAITEYLSSPVHPPTPSLIYSF